MLITRTCYPHDSHSKQKYVKNEKKKIWISIYFLPISRIQKLIGIGRFQAIKTDVLLIFSFIIKLRLHYNELAQRTATVWRYLTFGDIWCYTLKKSDECDH